MIRIICHSFNRHWCQEQSLADSGTTPRALRIKTPVMLVCKAEYNKTSRSQLRGGKKALSVSLRTGLLAGFLIAYSTINQKKKAEFALRFFLFGPWES